MVVEHNHNHFEWSTIFAGSAVALVVTLVLSQFGSAIGLATDGPLFEDVSLMHWAVIATGIWLLWVQLISSVLGGYISGRMRCKTPEFTPHENELRDGIYGLVTWAVSSFGVIIGVGLVAGFSMLVDAINGPLAVVDDLTDKEQNAAVIGAFLLGSVSLLSAVASWWAATVGGDHRDKGTDFTRCITFR